MFTITNRRFAWLAALVISTVLAACAVRPPPRSFPERPFDGGTLARVRVGMPADSLVALFGPPDTTYAMAFGAETDRPWDGVAYRYYAAKDSLYYYVDAWKRNTFYFFRSPDGLVLNHWVIRHRTGSRGN